MTNLRTGISKQQKNAKLSKRHLYRRHYLCIFFKQKKNEEKSARLDGPGKRLEGAHDGALQLQADRLTQLVGHLRRNVLERTSVI